MGTIFSETLVKFRKEAGFPTAYRFFHDNCGSKVLGMCYRKYLTVEQGRLFPQFKHLRAIGFGLRLVPGSVQVGQLLRAWLRTMAGDESYAEMIEPMLAAGPGRAALSPANRALKEALAGRKFYITQEQLEVISGSAESYLCFQLFSNDSGVWTEARLAAASGLGRAAAGAVIKNFSSAGMLRKTRTGYKCPLAGAMLELPRRAAVPDLFARIEGYQNRLMSSGSAAWSRRGIFRADAAALADFYPLMDLNLSSAQAYAVTEGTGRSALFLVDARAVKLRDF